MRKSISLLLLLIVATRLSAKKLDVYFIGNSYTHTNSMPDMLKSFAAAKGDTLYYEMSAPGGFTLQGHSTSATTIAGIYSRPWDVVVIHEQSQRPAFPPAQVATEVYPYAARLDSFVNDNDTCTEVMFMMTWGRRNGDVMNCPSYPAVCTYHGMQGRLRDSYMQMAVDNNASVAPMGTAWNIVVDSFPAIDLYLSDSSHPSLAGSYLQACVFYASLFHKPASGCTYLGGVPLATAQILQRIADKVVLDSLDFWQQHGRLPYSGFTRVATGANSFSFTNSSARANSYLWTFGDGSTDTATNPSHTYTATGTFTVTLSATNSCFTDVFTDTVRIAPVGVQSVAVSPSLVIKSLPGGRVVIEPETEGIITAIALSDLNGRIIAKSTSGKLLEVHLPPSIYICEATTNDGNTIRLKVLVQ